ncbi:MFS transporter [Actinocrispum wychmicini]|uniref:Transmembrane secretion effector n=1 Tax=Actinocrispum wychmicini TaxID=1213861 RepID=A0A4R2ILE4_9PSEU|nr:MFS transporter [Actinocrispum wychmicini]TCO45312.1 transmembrane secretion effector [Actinocrispum wychmicini]
MRAELWRHRDFLKLWGGQTLAMFGTAVGRTALPLVAVVMLNASATQMGFMNALSQLPFLLFLFAGVWVDRVRRRYAMVWTDIGRFVLLALVPSLYAVGWLRIEALYVIVFCTGVLGVMFEIAYHAYLPTLTGRELVAEGNQKLELSRSAAGLLGPAATGVAISAVASAMVLVVSAATHLISAAMLLLIRKPDTMPSATHTDGVLRAIREGLHWVVRHPVLRTIASASAIFYGFTSALQTLYVLYLIRVLNVPPGWVAAIFAAAGPGALAGSWLSVRLMRKVGVGTAVMWAVGCANGILLLIPAASLVSPLWLVVALLVTSQFGYGLSTQVGTIIQTTLRQLLTPDEMQGRVVATLRALSMATVPVGALAAGVLADAIGIQPLVWIGSIGLLGSFVIYVFSPIPRMRAMPTEEEAAAMAPEMRAHA